MHWIDAQSHWSSDILNLDNNATSSIVLHLYNANLAALRRQ